MLVPQFTEPPISNQLFIPTFHTGYQQPAVLWFRFRISLQMALAVGHLGYEISCCALAFALC